MVTYDYMRMKFTVILLKEYSTWIRKQGNFLSQ